MGLEHLSSSVFGKINPFSFQSADLITVLPSVSVNSHSTSKESNSKNGIKIFFNLEDRRLGVIFIPMLDSVWSEKIHLTCFLVESTHHKNLHTWMYHLSFPEMDFYYWLYLWQDLHWFVESDWSWIEYLTWPIWSLRRWFDFYPIGTEHFQQANWFLQSERLF